MLALALILPATPAFAKQMDVRDEPTSSGEVDLVTSQCGRAEKKVDGQVAAVARSCLYFYEFDSADESDAALDYGIVWLQTTLNAREGWCTTKVNSDVRLLEGTTPYADGMAPAEQLTTDIKKTVTVKLATKARENSALEGSVEQSFDLYPMSATAILKEIKKTPQEDHLFRLQWKGSSRKKLGFASGIEVSWDAFEGRPEEFPIWVRFQLAKQPSC